MAEEYTCSLSERDLQVARKELGEDPKERLGQVETFRQWILQQPHIKCDTDIRYLLRFLRASKFSQLRAREKLEKFLTVKAKNPDIMANIDMAHPKIQKFLGSGYVVTLPDKPDGKKVWLIRTSLLDTSNKHYTNMETMSAMMGMFLNTLGDESVQVQGITFLLDMTDMPLNIITYYGVENVKRWMSILQGALPIRIKGFHYYNTGPVFEALMAIVRPITPKKLQDRIYVHGSNMEEVYKHIPMSILPDEYLPDDYTGPSAGPFQTLVDKLQAEMIEPAVRNRILKETSDAFSADVSKRSKDEPRESFRKLNVD